MFMRFYSPRPELATLVKGYQIAHIKISSEVPTQSHPFPPHAVQNLSFYPRDPVSVYSYRTGQTTTNPPCIAVGAAISCVNFTMGRDLLIIATFFEPGGLHRLLRLPMVDFFDEALDVSLVWNKDIREVNERLRNATDYDEMHRIVETFLLHRLRQSDVAVHPLDATLKYLSDPTRPISLDYLADQACLSPRQFERKCGERLGLSPKLFRRLARFSKAFRLKEQRPNIEWLDIALHFGYYDLQHMRRDFRLFAGATPSLLIEEETRTLVRPYSSHQF